MHSKLEHGDHRTRMSWSYPGIYLSAAKNNRDPHRHGWSSVSIDGTVKVRSHELPNRDTLYSIQVTDPEWDQEFTITVNPDTFGALREAINEMES